MAIYSGFPVATGIIFSLIHLLWVTKYIHTIFLWCPPSYLESLRFLYNIHKWNSSFFYQHNPLLCYMWSKKLHEWFFFVLHCGEITLQVLFLGRMHHICAFKKCCKSLDIIRPWQCESLDVFLFLSMFMDPTNLWWWASSRRRGGGCPPRSWHCRCLDWQELHSPLSSLPCGWSYHSSESYNSSFLCKTHKTLMA